MYDISLTPRGANPTTSVALRSLEAALAAEPETINQNPEPVENHEKEAEVRANAFVDASAVQGQLSKSEERNLAKFNLIKAINEARSGKLTGIEAEVNQEGMNEKRKPWRRRSRHARHQPARNVYEAYPVSNRRKRR
jgi:hypothetical protein